MLPCGFFQSKWHDRAHETIRRRDVTALYVTLPWVEAEARETIALMGPDYWRYGVAESRKDIEAMARYSYQQGLAIWHMKPEELFATSTLEISKI